MRYEGFLYATPEHLNSQWQEHENSKRANQSVLMSRAWHHHRRPLGLLFFCKFCIDGIPQLRLPYTELILPIR